MKKRVLVGILGAVLSAGLVAGYAVRSARADGVPAASALTYAGVLTDASGVPLTGTKNIQVSVWTAATAGTKACDIGPEAKTLSAGHFEIVLPDACTTQVHAKSDLGVEVIVDGQSLGRSKIGAVPYALEAASASGASGYLDTRITDLEVANSRPNIYAAQNLAVSTDSTGGWIDVPGMSTGTFQTTSGTLDLFAAVDVQAGDGATECLMRFVVDGTPLAADGRVGVNTKYTIPFSSRLTGDRRIDVSAGAHTVSVQIAKTSGIFGGTYCSAGNATSNKWGRLRVVGN